MPEDPQAPLRRVAPDRYSEFELIGKGGMGVVYLALDSELNRRVAFKIVLPEADEGSASGAPQTPLEATPPRDSESGSGRSFEELKVRFLQEAWVTSGMEHPGIVPVYELGETDEGVPYYTMRYVRGDRTMKEAIAAAEDLDDRLFLLEPFLKVCDTLRYAHARGVVHRDLKPENIAIGEFGEVVVLDWGLAKVEGRPDVTTGLWQQRIEAYRDASDLKTVAGALGTPGFMAPEAALGRSEEVDTRSDVYSLGVLLFRILTGRLPFEFDDFMGYVNQVVQEDPPRADAIDPTVPRELADACQRALAREREERYEHVDELAHAVRVWQTEGPIEREIRALLDQARDEVKAAQGLEGNLLLLHLDRATTSINRILHLQADQDAALELQARVKRMRERGIRARVRSDRLSVLQRVAAGLLCIGAIVALVVFGMLTEARRRADERQREAEREIDDARRDREFAFARAEAADADVAMAYAVLANSLLEEKRNAAAKLLAATGLMRRTDPSMWRLFARAETGWAPTLRLLAHDVRARSLHVSGGRDPVLLVGDDEGRVHMVGRPEGRIERHSWDALGAAVTALARVPGPEEGSEFIVAGGADGRVVVLEPGGTQPSLVIPEELPAAPDPIAFEDATLYRGTAVTALAPGPTPGSILAGFADGRLRLYDTGGVLVHVARHHAGAVTAIESEAGLVLTGAADGCVNLWKTEGLLLLDTWEGAAERPVAGLRSTGNRSVEAWSRDGTLWPLQVGGEASEPLVRGRPEDEVGAALLAGARFLASAGRDGVLRYRDARDGSLLAQGASGGAAITALAADADGLYVAVARDDDTVRVWDVAMRVDEAATGVAHRASGRVAATRADGSIRVWPIAGADPIVLPSDEPDRISALAFDDRGDRLISVSLSGRIAIWNTGDGEQIRRLRGQETPLTAVAWAQGEKRLLTGDLNGAVRIWPWATGRPLSLPDAAPVPITLLTAETPVFRVAAADSEGTVHLWDSAAREKLGSWRGLGRLVALALAPDGERMAAARADGIVLRWDGSAWMEQGRLPDGARPVEFLLDADGRLTWVDQRGLAGTDLRHDPTAALSAQELGPPWVLADPADRLSAMTAAFGLRVVDKYTIAAALPEGMPNAVSLAR